MSSSLKHFEARVDGFQWFQVVLRDFKDGKLLVSYEADWKQPEWISAAAVRHAQLEWDKHFVPVAGTDVEVMSRSSENGPLGWFEAKLQMIRADFCMIHYKGGSDPQTVVEKEAVRPLCSADLILNPAKLDVRYIEFPASLLSWLSNASQPFLKIEAATNILSIALSVDNTKLVVIGTTTAVTRAAILVEAQLQYESELQTIRDQTAQTASKLKATKEKVDNNKKLEFSVAPHLIGYVIGSKGENLNKALKIPGVASIKVVQESNVVRILAQTEDAAQEARAILEYVEEYIELSPKLVAWVIGKGGQNVREIETKTQCLHVRVDDGSRDFGKKGDNKIVHARRGTKERPLVIVVGLRDHVESALLLLRHRIEYQEEFHRVKETQRSLETQVRKLENDFGVSSSSSSVAPLQFSPASASWADDAEEETETGGSSSSSPSSASTSESTSQQPRRRRNNNRKSDNASSSSSSASPSSEPASSSAPAPAAPASSSSSASQNNVQKKNAKRSNNKNNSKTDQA